VFRPVLEQTDFADERIQCRTIHGLH
jgi:hypothetical protein